MVVVPLEDFFELMGHNVWLEILRHSERSKFLQRDGILVVPVQYRVKVAALVVHTEVRECVLLRIQPCVGVYIDVGGAHKILQEHIKAVRNVEVVIFIVLLLVAIIVVVIAVEVHPKAVEAMDLVKDIYAANVRIWTKSERRRKLGGTSWILTLSYHIFSADSDRALCLDTCPCGINFGRWSLSENGHWFFFKEGTIHTPRL